ncbi:MAG: hypothetical protein DMG14_32725 [Acidobacteria bacterium]|nr:MAG: hypothetical protein DMG14_32725 [Acidobacteriota bacterium]
MPRINVKGVIIGGLLAGLIINIGESILNIPVLGAQLEVYTVQGYAKKRVPVANLPTRLRRMQGVRFGA